MRLFCHLSISSIHRKAGPDPNNEAELRPQRKGPVINSGTAPLSLHCILTHLGLAVARLVLGLKAPK